MIKIKFYNDDHRFREMTVEGHAGYAEKGKDIVCASVSAIALSLFGFLENSDCQCNTIGDDSGGYLRITALVNHDAVVAFQMAEIGMAQIAKAFPEYVEISF